MDNAEFAQEQCYCNNAGFAVEPITTCPHIPASITAEVFINTACEVCNEPQENWQCLTCNTVRCSRYRQGHMLEHFETTADHAVCLSYSDLSVWCFICENYIANKALDEIKHAAYLAKFDKEPPVTKPLVVQSTNGASGSSSNGAAGSSKQ
ncbi:hypothetical protein BDB00DRAFT_799526 [Zychaea mexicana]|uniref:uncharacterized protein n=1 Tax=Zychaea mexicana TaxID=64656 RepID=UPI0022FDF224|nr:uncharacterized protein BDB00DRAFT_799526 [Zychaea mexicana]KAI9498792.1 hypothetical protein BDB00DRAFT_799526 [Zychaea mexicana]